MISDIFKTIVGYLWTDRYVNTPFTDHGETSSQSLVLF